MRGVKELTDLNARGVTKDFNFVYGFYYIEDCKKPFIVTYERNFIEVEKIDRGTCLTDKKVRRIFENDIVKFNVVFTVTGKTPKKIQFPCYAIVKLEQNNIPVLHGLVNDFIDPVLINWKYEYLQTLAWRGEKKYKNKTITIECYGLFIVGNIHQNNYINFINPAD